MTATAIETLLSAPATAETGRALLDWVQELRGRIVSGEMHIGILSVEEVEKAQAALRKAGECGVHEGWFQLAVWLANPPFGAHDTTAAHRVLRDAIASGVPGARVELVRLQWFYRRDEATPAEQDEAHAILREVVTEERGIGRPFTSSAY